MALSTEDYLAIAGNNLLTDVHETLLRQVHPVHLDDNKKPTSQAFEPTKQHNFLLSTKREEFGVEAACQAHRKKNLTAGTWGVTVGLARTADVPAIDDALHLGDDGHASLSFLDRDTRGKRTQSARKLRDNAICLHIHDADEHDSDAKDKDSAVTSAEEAADDPASTPSPAAPEE